MSIFYSDDLTEKEIEIKLEISKKAGLLRKPCKFVDVNGRIDEKIDQNENLANAYIDRNPVHRSIQVSADCRYGSFYLVAQNSHIRVELNGLKKLY